MSEVQCKSNGENGYKRSAHEQQCIITREYVFVCAPSKCIRGARARVSVVYVVSGLGAVCRRSTKRSRMFYKCLSRRRGTGQSSEWASGNSAGGGG